MLRIDKYGDPLLETSATELLDAPRLPQVDRIPAHVETAYAISDDDAEVVCVPDCPACAVEWSLSRFWDEVGGSPDDGPFLG
jgi:hypothetical protein